MRIGIMLGADGAERDLNGLIEVVKQAEAAGLDNVWLANVFGHDAITALALAGRETQRIGLGTAVTPTYPRHPTAIAQQAMTAQAACSGRFTLGIGLSHKVVIEDMLGLSYARRASHMREYLGVLMPAIRGEAVRHQGEEYRVRGLTMNVPGSDGLDVVVAALGPAMLKVAGELADGTNTWMVGPKTMRDHIIPGLAQAAEAAGRTSPRVVGGYPLLLTRDADAARQKIGAALTVYGQLPSYRAMLDREGVAAPENLALLGDENFLRGELKRLEDMGVTDFNGAVMGVEPGGYERTLDFLASLKG